MLGGDDKRERDKIGEEKSERELWHKKRRE
jgi:hypothetical protein